MLITLNNTLIRKICLYISNSQSRMKYEFKHGTISLKTLKQAVTCNRLTMANESDYESDAVRKFFDLNRWNFYKKNNKSHKTGRLDHGSVAQFCATEPWSSCSVLCD